MLKIKLLRTLVFIENMIGIYRNMFSFNYTSKMIAVSRATFSVVLFTAAGLETLVSSLFSIKSDLKVSLFYIGFSTVTTVNCLIPIINAINQTQSFKVFTESIDDAHEYCRKGDEYMKKLKNIKKLVNSMLVVLITVYVITFSKSLKQWFNQFKDKDVYVAYMGIFQCVLAYWKEVRFQIEILIFNVFLRVMSLTLSHLKTELVQLLHRIESDNCFDEISYNQFRLEFIKWTETYTHVAISSDSLASCFGLQITVSLFILTLYFIGLSYLTVFAIVSDNALVPGTKSLVLLFNYTLAIVSLLYTCQHAQNEAESLRSLMDRLLNKLLTRTNLLEMERLMKDFRRQMWVHPIKIKVLTVLDIEMSLLLVIISSAINYTIVLLQFSHVV